MNHRSYDNFFHHENDEHIPMSRYQDHYGDKIKFVHIPHCDEEEVFKQCYIKPIL